MIVHYDDVVAAVAPTGMIVRGGFRVDDDEELPPAPGGRPTRTVIVIGNVGGAMWPRFRREEVDDPHPLDAWTRATLRPIADRFDATFVHPSDEPFQPFQRWARRADDVWQSPIGLLVHGEYGLWHAYRGAFLLTDDVEGLPAVGVAEQPCLTCAEQPCLTACPVDAFRPGAGVHDYDHVACRAHVASDDEPDCAHLGCMARRACPIGTEYVYGPDQMAFHMRAFVGT